jgi:hypothetical protein
MFSNCSKHWIAGLLILGLILAGCGAATPEAGQPTSTLAQSALPSPAASSEVTVPPTAAPTSTPAPTPTPATAPTPGSVQLAVLHTNDNWGETEPCG